MRIQLKDISAVGLNKTSLITLPVGRYRYLRIVLVVGLTSAGNGNAPAIGSLGEIRLNYLNGIQRRVTATRLDAINTENGAQYASQVYQGGANGTGRRHIPIYLAEPWRNRQEADALAWQTGFFGPSDSFIIEVENVTNDVLTAYADVDEFVGSKGPHPIIKWNTKDFPASGTPIEITKLDERDGYTQIDVLDTSDAKTVERVRIVQGSREIFDLSKNENTTHLKNTDMNPAAGSFCVCFDVNDNFLGVVQAQGLTMTVTPSAAAAGTITLVTQRIGRPE